MLMASADQISIKDINDGRSNMWIVYSNAVITVIVAIGLVTQYQSEMVYFLISQLCFCFGHYTIAKSINPNIKMLGF